MPNDTDPIETKTAIVGEVDLSALTRPELVELATTKHGIVLKGNPSKATLLQAIARATTNSTYVCLHRVKHDGEIYLPGAEIVLSSVDALPLLAKKLVGVAI